MSQNGGSDRRSNYAKILSEDDCSIMWAYLEDQYGIQSSQYRKDFGFAKSKKGRIWIASKTAIEFVQQDLENSLVMT